MIELKGCRVSFTSNPYFSMNIPFGRIKNVIPAQGHESG